jgi:DNA-binding LacI/PurR family transcriptional regulator
MAHHLSSILHERRRDAQVYYVPWRRLKKSKVHNDLLCDLEEHRLAGLIWLSSPPADLLETARRAVVPMVGVTVRESLPHTVWIDQVDFCGRAVERLKEEGCRRASLIGFSTDVETLSVETLLAAAAAEGMRLSAEDVPEILLDDVAAARGEGLAARFDLDRYDGAVLADDILAVGFTRGLLRRGVKIPDDLRLVTMWNRDNPLSLALPAARFEVNVEELARRSIGMLNDLIEERRVERPHVYVKMEEPSEPVGHYASMRETVLC